MTTMLTSFVLFLSYLLSNMSLGFTVFFWLDYMKKDPGFSFWIGFVSYMTVVLGYLFSSKPFRWCGAAYQKFSARSAKHKLVVSLITSGIHFLVHYTTEQKGYHQYLFELSCALCVLLCVIIKHSAQGEDDKTGVIVNVIRQFFPLVIRKSLLGDFTPHGIVALLLCLVLEFVTPVSVDRLNHFYEPMENKTS